MLKNRKPADELADVRAEMKLLKEREDELREILLAKGADLAGSECYARIDVVPQKRLDRKKLEEKFGKAALKDCFTETEVSQIRIIYRNLYEAA